MKSTFALAVLCMLALPAPALAQAAEQESSQEPDSLQVLLQQQQALRADLEDGGISGLTPRQNSMVRKAQAEFFAVAEGKTSLDGLTIDEKIRMENALELINAQVKDTRAAADDQNVCWREKVSGTTMKKTRCGTQAEMREAREGARDYLERPKVCGQDCGEM